MGRGGAGCVLMQGAGEEEMTNLGASDSHEALRKVRES